MIALVDYGMGNLHSVQSAFEATGAEVTLARRPEDLEAADRIVLPGVGAFAECLGSLRASGLVDALTEQVIERRKPFLGICVGLQVLARTGEEGGETAGLGWLPGVVRRLDSGDLGLKVPHVGWNEVTPKPGVSMFAGLRSSPTFYFVHSYHLVPDDPSMVAATADYGVPITAALQYRNMFATQFHPEKSQQNGLRVLENFLEWTP